MRRRKYLAGSLIQTGGAAWKERDNALFVVPHPMIESRESACHVYHESPFLMSPLALARKS